MISKNRLEIPEVFGKNESSASKLKFSELHTVLLQNQQKLRNYCKKIISKKLSTHYRPNDCEELRGDQGECLHHTSLFRYCVSTRKEKNIGIIGLHYMSLRLRLSGVRVCGDIELSDIERIKKANYRSIG